MSVDQPVAGDASGMPAEMAGREANASIFPSIDDLLESVERDFCIAVSCYLHMWVELFAFGGV